MKDKYEKNITIATALILIVGILLVFLDIILSGIFLFLAFGLFCIYYSCKAFLRLKKSSAWPQSKAIILHSFIHTSKEPGNISWYEVFSPIVEYEYRVNELSYRSKRISITPSDFNFYCKDKAAQSLKDLQANFDCVYYDPDNPDFSIIKNESSYAAKQQLLVFSIIGIFLFTASILVTYFAFAGK